MFEDSLSKDNPILFGNMYAILMIIILVRQLELRKLRFWYLIPLGLCIYFVLLSGSRGVLASFVVSMVFYLFVISKIRLKTKFFIISAILFLKTSHPLLVAIIYTNKPDIGKAEWLTLGANTGVVIIMKFMVIIKSMMSFI